jgi:hypothetical protein
MSVIDKEPSGYYFIAPPGQVYIIAEDPRAEERQREHPDLPLISQVQMDLIAEKVATLSKDDWDAFAREFTKKAIEAK